MMKRISFCILFLSVFIVQSNVIFTQTLDSIVAPGTPVEKISGALAITSANGLCWDNGNLYFTNVNVDTPKESRTYRMNSEGKIDLIQDNNGIIMAIRSSGKGTFYCCELANHRVIEMNGSGKVLGVVADKYKDASFEGPIDIAVDARGGMYFADSPYYYQTINYIPMNSGVFYRSPDGTLRKVAESINCPYAVALSPDGTKLYLVFAGGEDGGKAFFSYDVKPDGSLSYAKKMGELEISVTNDAIFLFWQLSYCYSNPAPNPASCGGSGCSVDAAGNLYVATNQELGIQVFSPSGAHIGNIPTPSPANDCCFGGPDMKTLFVAAKDGVYRVRTNIPGAGIAMNSLSR